MVMDVMAQAALSVAQAATRAAWIVWAEAKAKPWPEGREAEEAAWVAWAAAATREADAMREAAQTASTK